MESKVGNIESRGQITLRNYAICSDFAFSSQQITLQNGAVCPVKNANYSFSSDVLPSGIATYPVDFSGVPQLTTVVNTNETANLTPGRYWNYTCRINGKLKLTSGVYYFHSLYMENNSIIECDVTSGPVKIFISDFYYSGATCNIIGGDASKVFYGYSGTNTADVDKLKGTLIAPNAT